MNGAPHRCCATCRYYHGKTSQCRVDAPKVVVVSGVPQTVVPTREPDFWCGDWSDIVTQISASEKANAERAIIECVNPQWPAKR